MVSACLRLERGCTLIVPAVRCGAVEMTPAHFAARAGALLHDLWLATHYMSDRPPHFVPHFVGAVTYTAVPYTLVRLLCAIPRTLTCLLLAAARRDDPWLRFGCRHARFVSGFISRFNSEFNSGLVSEFDSEFDSEFISGFVSGFVLGRWREEAGFAYLVITRFPRLLHSWLEVTDG